MYPGDGVALELSGGTSEITFGSSGPSKGCHSHREHPWGSPVRAAAQSGTFQHQARQCSPILQMSQDSPSSPPCSKEGPLRDEPFFGSCSLLGWSALERKAQPCAGCEHPSPPLPTFPAPSGHSPASLHPSWAVPAHRSPRRRQLSVFGVSPAPGSCPCSLPGSVTGVNSCLSPSGESSAVAQQGNPCFVASS